MPMGFYAHCVPCINVQCIIVCTDVHCSSVVCTYTIVHCTSVVTAVY